MKRFEKPSLLRRFSHIYLERAARETPLAKRVLTRFKDSQVVQIDNYKRVFNRPKQCFSLQKQAPKLIIAIKKPPFLYRGSDNCQSYGYQNFFYTTPMLGCPFNCDYCYLQGMYPSAYIVLFANHTDFLEAARKQAVDSPAAEATLYTSISYDTDILPFEDTTHYAREWIHLARETPNLRLEIRTKSAAYRALHNIPPSPKVVLSWSLAPPDIVKLHEHGAPSLDRRLSAIKQAIADGWPVRLCFDPVLPTADLEDSYGKTVSRIFEEVSPNDIADATVGPFRMGKTHFQRIKRMRRDCALFYGGAAENTLQAVKFVTEKLSAYLPEEKVILWKSQL